MASKQEAKPPGGKAAAGKKKKASPSKTSRAGVQKKPRGGHRSTTRAKGWGGPAKGKGAVKPAYVFDGKPGPGRGNFSIAGEERKEQKNRRVESLYGFLWDLVFEPTKDSSLTAAVRATAADKLLNRLEGLPVQRVISSTTDDLSMMTDKELDDDITAGERKRAAAAAGAVGADLSEGSQELGS